MEKDGRAYCREDFNTLFSTKCSRCDQSILTEIITAIGKSWHKSCFTCVDCMQPFPAGDFFDIDGQPYCNTHHASRRNLSCAGCQQLLGTGRVVNAAGKRWHPEHFKCSKCATVLVAGGFSSLDSKPYCLACYARVAK
eukprot:m.580506 g.580506  ORF g.580506 m.580506 type:complete len:138 (+) comp57928_c0_seq8:158-571(+)